MTVVFGTYSIKQKSYSYEDLGIKDVGNEIVSIEVRQKMFHVFWIPVFPVGKVYAFRKNNTLYELPEQLIELIKSKEKIPVAWYSFALPILVMIGLLGSFVVEKYERYTSYQKAKTRFEEKTNSMMNDLKKLTTNHYIKVQETGDYDYSNSKYLKVISIKNNDVYVSLFQSGLDSYNAKTFEIENSYLLAAPTCDTLKLSLNDLTNGLCKSYDDFEKVNISTSFFTLNNTKYYIEDIVYVNGPSIIDRGTGGSSGTTFYLEFNNFGAPVELTEIKNLEGELNWTDELPMEIPTSESDYDYFTINADNYKNNEPYKLQLTFTDSLSKTYRYTLEGKDMDNELKRLDN